MISKSNSIFKKSILFLIGFNIIAGIVVFRDYGLSWDEPLFYDYGDALGYAYSPTEWFSGHFDLYQSYGASGDDHKNRGPAYLFLARNFVYGLEALGSDSASAWHLINFLFFQLGIYFLYRFSKRWLDEAPAIFTAAFFSFQPLLWGHSFINPKDPPFLTFFLASVCLGFEMVDTLSENGANKNRIIIIAAFSLGIATSIRVLGPLAGFLVFLYFLSKQPSMSAWKSFLFYGVTAIATMFLTWPYLWENPFGNFINVFAFMSDNPTQLPILFMGETFRADTLPHRYLPFMLATTLTEPFLPLILLGALSFTIYINQNLDKDKLLSLLLTLSWFGTLTVYILVRRPSMYDGIRHFLFILPPLFILAGMGFQQLTTYLSKLKHSAVLLPVLIVALLSPGFIGIVKLHPYEYAYYNSFVGGTSGAFRSYETDYWLTCYKEAVEKLNSTVNQPANLFVKREAYIAKYYANDNTIVRDLRGSGGEVKSGDYILVNSRTNEDLSTARDAQPILKIKRGNALFCTIKVKP